MDIRRRFLSIFNKNTIDDYLTIEALEDGLTVSLSLNDCEYSIDGINNWTSVAAGTATEPINTGQTISFRGNLSSINNLGIGTFTVTKNFNLKGNAMSMLYNNAARYCNKTKGSYTFYKLFYGCKTLINVSKNFLPATTVGWYSYHDMFSNCSNLLTAPELPATILDGGSYRGMFSSCKSLTEAPELPATSVYTLTYMLMFEGCTNLVTGPSKLPATTINTGCYYRMFKNCTKLTNTPNELPALTLFSTSYYEMYYACSSITKAPELLFTTTATECCYNMFYGCTNLVLAPSILSAETLTKDCYRLMFYNCKSLQKAPELPATTLAEQCYRGMFGGCTNLTEAPELPAPTLTNGCYQGMFEHCYNLVSTPYLPASNLASDCYHGMFKLCTSLITVSPIEATTLAYNCCFDMFNKCTSLTTVPELPATVLADSCYLQMFYGCTSLVSCPALPAVDLMEQCYYGMFRECTSLTEAPELPATHLAVQCYLSMFTDCTNLTRAPLLSATTLASECYAGMFSGCSSLTTAPELPATNLASACYRNMFSGCSSLTTAPELPATILQSQCYKRMFYECVLLTEAPALNAEILTEECYMNMFYNTAITSIKMLATDISADRCLLSWVYSVPDTGTFIKSRYMHNLPIGINGIPTNWVIESDFNISECINLSITADDVVGNKTTTNLHITMTVNGFDLNGNYLEGITLEFLEESEVFELNTSTTDSVTKTISYSCLDKTATTTFSHQPYIYNYYEVLLNDDWRLSETIPNPNSNMYSGTYESFSNYNITNGCAFMYIDLYDCDSFDLYIRSYAGSDAYIIVSKLDAIIHEETTSDYINCYDTTRNQSNANTSIEGYKLVKFSDISPGKHRITIMYRKSDNIYHYNDDRGYVLIPYKPNTCKELTIISASDVLGSQTTSIVLYEALCETYDPILELYKEITITGFGSSNAFPINESKTESITRTILFTYLGVTVSTTITQLPYPDLVFNVLLNDNWRLSTSITNPDPDLYDGVYESFSNYNIGNGVATMYIDIVGYSNFKLYIRSNAESSYDYMIISQLDLEINGNTSITSLLVKDHTSNRLSSGTDISNYRLVEYTDIDGSSHRITILYRKDSSVNRGDDRGYILIPKNQ